MSVGKGLALDRYAPSGFYGLWIDRCGVGVAEGSASVTIEKFAVWIDAVAGPMLFE